MVVILLLLHLFLNDKLFSFSRPEPHPRGAAQQPDSPLQEQDEEILGSDDEEQEDPNDYCKGTSLVLITCLSLNYDIMYCLQNVCVCGPQQCR